MYPVMLAVHNLLRWVFLVLAVVAVARAVVGWVNRSEWRVVDDRLGLFLVLATDIQLLVGLVLYVFLSPMMKVVFSDIGAAMGNAGLRFFAVEHVFGMLVAVVAVHLGRALSKRAPEARVRHLRSAIWYLVALAATLLAIPWARPLFRAFG
jgi:hypothetical protein